MGHSMKLSPTARIAAFGLCAFALHFLLCVSINYVMNSVNDQEQRLLEKTINKELIKIEIGRFRADFFSGSATTPQLNVTCLEEAEVRQHAFAPCKTSDRLLYSVNSSTFDIAFQEQYSIEDFCISLEKHRECMQRQAKIACTKLSHVTITLPFGSLCRNSRLARLGYSNTWLIIALDLPLMALLALIFFACQCLHKGCVKRENNQQRDRQVNGQLDRQEEAGVNANGSGSSEETLA